MSTNGSPDHERMFASVIPRQSDLELAVEHLEAVDVGPCRVRGGPGCEVAEGRQLEQRPAVALPIAEPWQVDGQDDRAVAGGRGTLDELACPARIDLDVELEPAHRVGGSRGHLLDRPARGRGQRERDAGGPAARAVATSPSGWASPWTAIGAMATGRDVGMPSIVVEGSTVATSTSTRGRSR